MNDGWCLNWMCLIVSTSPYHFQSSKPKQRHRVQQIRCYTHATAPQHMQYIFRTALACAPDLQAQYQLSCPQHALCIPRLHQPHQQYYYTPSIPSTTFPSPQNSADPSHHNKESLHAHHGNKVYPTTETVLGPPCPIFAGALLWAWELLGTQGRRRRCQCRRRRGVW